MNILIVRNKRAFLESRKKAEACPFANVKRWTAGASIESPDAKKFNVIKDGDKMIDIQDVTLEGYLSTFKHITESDRDGDYVEKGSFKDTLPRFMKNPVLLANHTNHTNMLVGKFTDMKEDSRGLHFKAQLSNAPDVQSIRFKVAEGMLKTTSMGGLLHYKEDGRGIFKVDLFEGSLTPIPANPDALFQVRALDETEIKFLKCGGSYASMHDFLLDQNRAA